MTTRLLSDIVQTVRDRGDYRNPVKFTDEIITREIQAAFAELYQLITNVNEGYFDTYATLTTRSNVAFVALPSDSWRVRAIDLIDSSGNAIELVQVGIDQRNSYGTIAGCPVAYRLTARGVDLYPTPDQTYTLRLLYTPSAPDLRAPVFVGSSTANAGVLTTPSGVAAGDTMLIVVAGSSVTTVPDGWYNVLTLTSTNAVPCTILRRTADGSEVSIYTVVASGASMVMLVYRNLDTIADIVDSAIADVTASRSFACPTLTTASTMDLYIGIAATTDSATTFQPPFATTERIDVTQGSLRISAFDVQPLAIATTGVKTALSATAHTGVAASIALALNPSREFYNGWEEYIVYGACLRLSGEEESTRSDWVTLQDRARQMAIGGATGRRSAEPQLIPLMDDGW